MTRATVTGASGLVGANLLRSLLDRGIEVCAADLRRSPALDGLDVDFVEVNVRDRSSLAAAFDGADVVFHLAAMISIVGDPTGEVRKVNVEGPANVANAARDAGVERVVHCSSVHAFDLEKCGAVASSAGPPFSRSQARTEAQCTTRPPPASPPAAATAAGPPTLAVRPSPGGSPPAAVTAA